MAKRVRLEDSESTSDTTGTATAPGSSGSGTRNRPAKKKEKKPCPFSIEKTRLTLLEKIKDPDDREHWDYFLEVYGSFIKRIARDKGQQDVNVEHVYNVVLNEVNKKIGEYDPGKGKFRSWLKTMVSRRCIDLFRKENRLPTLIDDHFGTAEDSVRGRPTDRLRDPGNSLETVWDQEEAGAVLRIAQRIAKAQVTPRNWQIFQCRVLRDWSVARVCETLGVTENVVNVAKAKVKPVFEAAILEAQARLDRGPLSPMDRKALEDSLTLPSYAKSK